MTVVEHIAVKLPDCPTPEEIRAWADNPKKGSKFVPVHRDTLRAIAERLDSIDELIGEAVMDEARYTREW